MLAGCETASHRERSLSAPRQGQNWPGAALSQLTATEQRLWEHANKDTQLIARAYASNDERIYPGIKALGNFLILEAQTYWPPLDFQTAVSRNPLFWLAALEVSPHDVSFPYLIASLAILSRDYTTAARMLALTQATLPLGPSMRRAYAWPEAMLAYHGITLLDGVPPASDIRDWMQASEYEDLVQRRLSDQPNNSSLLRALIEIKIRQKKLPGSVPTVATVGTESELLGTMLGLTAEVWQKIRQSDPVMGATLDASVDDWLESRTLLQKWIRWTDLGEPAEVADVEAFIRICQQAERYDLAWMAWRASNVLRPVMPTAEQGRWRLWSRSLVGSAEEAELARIASSPFAGTAMMGVLPEAMSVAWSGESEIHPLLVVQVDRRIALIDAILSTTPSGSENEGKLKLDRAVWLSSVRAIEACRLDLARAEQLLGRTDSVLVCKATLLADERRYEEADQLFAEVTKSPHAEKDHLFQYTGYLYQTARYDEAREQCRLLTKGDVNVYVAIMGELAARRAGTPGDQGKLRGIRDRLAPGSWHRTGISFLLGEVTEDELLDYARRGGVYNVVRNECEAYFWLSQLALAKGDVGVGIGWLRRCVSSGFTAIMEYRLAKAELERLAPEQLKREGPRDSGGSITA